MVEITTVSSPTQEKVYSWVIGYNMVVSVINFCLLNSIIISKPSYIINLRWWPYLFCENLLGIDRIDPRIQVGFPPDEVSRVQSLQNLGLPRGSILSSSWEGCGLASLQHGGRDPAEGLSEPGLRSQSCSVAVTKTQQAGGWGKHSTPGHRP